MIVGDATLLKNTRLIIADLEQKIKFYTEQLQIAKTQEALLTGQTVATASERNGRELAYEWLKKNDKGTISQMADAYYPGSKGEERQRILARFLQGLDTLIRNKAVKKINAAEGKRGHIYKFLQ